MEQKALEELKLLSEDLEKTLSAKVFESYIKAKYEYIYEIYRPEIFTDENIEALTELETAVYYSNKAFASKDNSEIALNLKKATEFYPPFKPIIAELVAPNAKENTPLENKFKELKATIYKLIATGKRQDAAELLLKYAQINPTDTDINIIRGLLK